MHSTRLFFSFVLFVASGFSLIAAPNFESATVTFIQHDVAVAELDVLEVDADGKIVRRPAELNQSIAETQAVLTGRRSRAELKLNDGTITRVGQLSSFTYGKGTRELQLKQGSALFVVPKGLGGTKVQAGPVTAAITGTTLLVQIFADRVVIYVYEGSVEVAGQNVRAGQVITLPVGGSPALAAFDTRRGIQTAALFTRFIEAESQDDIMRQIAAVAPGAPGLPINPADPDNTLVNPRINNDPESQFSPGFDFDPDYGQGG